MNLSNISVPTPMHAAHEVTTFACGEPTLDDWLKTRALRNEKAGASRTYVICDGNPVVVGYYCLAAGSLKHGEAPKPMRRNMPDPIPVMVLGRLAVDQRCQNMKLGEALLRDAIWKTLEASKVYGVVALVLDALNERAKKLYLRFGFTECPDNPMKLCLPLRTAERVLQEAIQ